ncbi:cobalamin B12-binding domain-containing protein [Megalodesulfovibrio gigas]|nr:cobalamin-dependent protein [Megalodesulfovibrio gigas]
MIAAMDRSACSPASASLTRLAAAYLEQLLAGNRRGACALVLDAVRAGADVREIYLKVLQPVQHEVGRLWQENTITVAVEHFCTAATQLVISQLFPYIITETKHGLSMVGCCVGEELHELGMRMVCDFFEMDGWDTYYMGANCPQDAVLAAMAERRPHALCLSVTMHQNVPLARDIIQAVATQFPAVKILVGGFPFLLNPDLAASLGAHGWARDAHEGVRLAAFLCRADQEDAA